MSQQNVELVRRHYEAFARGEVETALQMRAEQIEFRVAEHSVFDRGTPFRGRQEVTGTYLPPSGDGMGWFYG